MSGSDEVTKDLTVRLDQNLDALSDKEWCELAAVYKSAFAGEPWFEVGKCALDATVAVPPDSPCLTSRLTPMTPGSHCPHCELDVVEDAYPWPELIPDLNAILRGRIEAPNPKDGRQPDDRSPGAIRVVERERILYREHSRRRGLLLGAMFWRTTVEELIDKKYHDKPAEVHEIIREVTPADTPILYLDEIFADRSKRARKNLWNFREMCRAAAQLTDTDVVVFRTISTQLKNKTQNVFPKAESRCPGKELLDERHYIVIHIEDIAVGQAPDDPATLIRDPGFAEWLPAERQAEQELTDLFKRRCELHGFAPIETPAIESMDILTSGGGIERQIFTVGRPIADQSAERGSLGLHFDLTVPLARYVAEHFLELEFPFRRYQAQKVWRGEKDSPGRYREFYQFDFDVLGDGELSPHHEGEILQLAHELLSAAGVACEFHVSDSRFLVAVLGDLAPSTQRSVLRTIAEGSLAGPTHVRTQLQRLDVEDLVIDRIVAVLDQPHSMDNALAVADHSSEATTVLQNLQTTLDDVLGFGLPPTVVVPNLSLIRGLDYYTGFIFETVVPGRTAWGSICSGGRYDQLVARADAKTPGVGASIGLTRLFSLLRGTGYGAEKRQSPAQVTLVIADWERDHGRLAKAAASLRAAGVGVELAIEQGQTVIEATTAAELKGTRFVVYALSDDRAVVHDLGRRFEVQCPLDELQATISSLIAGP